MEEQNRITGHDRQRSFLERVLLSPAHHHMMIFAGPANVGKVTIARLFARAYIEACDVEWRVGVQTSEHPDIIMLMPREQEKKGVVTVKKITVDDVRDITKRASKTSRNGRRVLIVDDAQHMSLSAGNALLKLVEEPPKGMYIIFVTSDRARLLPTICSRGMTVNFGLCSRAQMLELGGVSEAIVDLSQSRPGIASRMVSDATLYEEARQSYEDLQNIRSWSAHERIEFATNLAKDAAKTRRYLELWLTRTRETAHTHRRPDYLLQYSQRIMDTLKVLQTTNTNARMTLENMLMHF